MKRADGNKSESTKQIENCLDYYEIRIKRSLRDPKFVLEVAGFIVLFVYAIYTIRMFYANRESADAAKSAAETAGKQLEMADRPWIKDTVRSASEFTANNGAFSWAVTIRTENVGKSVATAIYLQTKLIAIEGADFIDAPRRKARELCNEVSDRFEKVKNDPVVWSNAIFPGDWSEFSDSPILWPNEINKTTVVDAGGNLGKSVMPMLIGCVEYHYAASGKPHKTWFVYTLAHSDKPALPSPSRIFFFTGKSVPSANMVLIKADQFAD